MVGSLSFPMAAVSCSPSAYPATGTGLGICLTGKLGRAWVGALVSAWMVHGLVVGGSTWMCDKTNVVETQKTKALVILWFYL